MEQKSKSYKISFFYKFLNIILIVYWTFFAFLLVSNCFIRLFIYPVRYKEEVIKYSQEYDLDKYLIFSTIKVESNFDRNSKSSKGALGLMQILPSTAEFISKKLNIEEYDLFNENNNIQFGCFYIRYLLDKFGNSDTAIVAFNAGEGNVSSWLKNKEYSDDGITLKKIPYKESEEYLDKTKNTFEKYKKLYRYIVDK